jgi:hypothetical protein
MYGSMKIVHKTDVFDAADLWNASMIAMAHKWSWTILGCKSVVQGAEVINHCVRGLDANLFYFTLAAWLLGIVFTGHGTVQGLLGEKRRTLRSCGHQRRVCAGRRVVVVVCVKHN